MRLIDADALQKALAERWYEAPKKLSGIKVSMLIDEQPTIEPKRGRWIWKMVLDKGTGSMGYVCSECGRDYWHGNAFNYCPNCGARMENENGKVDNL